MSIAFLKTVEPTDEIKHRYHADLPAIISGALFGVTMFIAGFAIGAVRVIYLEPRLGDWNAFLVEVPIMLPICWLLSYQALLCWYFLNLILTWAEFEHHTHVDTITVTSFVTLISLEIALSMTLFHHTFAETRQEFTTRVGAAGLAMQLIACSFPVLQEARQERKMRVENKSQLKTE